VEHVTSRNNALVKRFRDVAWEGRIDDTVLLDGAHLLDEALRSAVTLEVAAFSDEAAVRHATLVDECERSGARVVTLPASLANTISPVRNGSGVMALARITMPELETVIATHPPQLLLVLDSVQDPGNVGAIIRTAEACGGSAVIAGAGTADPFGWKALRGSMGSAFRLPIAAADASIVLQKIRRARIRTFAMVPRGGVPLHRANLAAPSAILLGGEGAGLSHELTDSVDEQLTIEMRSPVESLNVSVAAALVLYEASRQRAHVAVR
jgi:RNA methyltransferase, TrmH family